MFSKSHFAVSGCVYVCWCVCRRTPPKLKKRINIKICGIINKSLGKVLRLISSASVNGKPRKRGRKGGGGEGRQLVSSTSKPIHQEGSQRAIDNETNKNQNVGIQPFHEVSPNLQHHLFCVTWNKQ